jgi:bacterioferritin
MIKREKSIELLNRAVNDELTAVHQYMYFHFRLDDMGYDLLSTYFKRTAIEEMMHVEMLAERILFLKGEVEMKPSHAVEKIHEAKSMLDKAEAMETQTIIDYNQFAQEAATALDSATKKLFEDLIVQEERHQDQFDTERDNLETYGDNYLALQSIEHAKKASAGTQTT